MKAVLICPAERPGVALLGDRAPLVVAPVLGRSVLELWIEWLAARDVKHVIVLATDRPNRVRAAVGDGRRWGLRIDVIPMTRELAAEEARAKFRRGEPGDGLVPADVIRLDHLPGLPGRPLFADYAGWFAAVRDWLPHAAGPGRIGVRQVMPGAWVGLHAEIDPTARLHPPCWIGDHVRVDAHAVIGPGAIVDDRAIVDDGARVTESVVGPDTYVGRHVAVAGSIADGSLLVDWRTGSSVRVPDAVLLSSLGDRPRRGARPTMPGRAAAGLVMLATAPFAAGVVALSVLRGKPPCQLRLGLRPQRGPRALPHEIFGYYELTGARNWLRRWPQFWSVVRGDLTWFGNRPLRPAQALSFATDFERLWLAAPVGLISLADAHGCREGVSDESCAHASYYAVHANARLDWFILSRALLQAAMVWPIHGHRRKDTAVPLHELVPKQEH